ncbi:IS5 family transposase [Burkholderia seminalis]|uniref:IS5 family transposase n=1 Tax=Burkholderia seminalis TaxID=488731 RepID=UPI001FC89765|nr:IS5 family transposase [Burkholderia seminalis]
MAKPIIDDELWTLIEPLLPPPKPRREKNPGCLPVSNRAALTGIPFVLKTGLRWRDLPAEMGCGSGVTCWRRLRDWQAACLGSLARATARKAARSGPDRLLTSRLRFIIDSRSWGRPKTGPNPTDRARPGSKHHLVTDANGTPLAAILTGANVNDVTQLLPRIDAIPPIRGLRGHPLQRPRVVNADRGYDSERHRRALRDRGIEPVIAKRRTEHGSGLGKYRWVVERTHAWLHHFRRLRIRFERRADIHGAFLKLGCCLIC